MMMAEWGRVKVGAAKGRLTKLGQGRVSDGELPGGVAIEGVDHGDKAAAGFLVVQDRVAVRESAALDVLAREAHVVPLPQHGPEREQLCGSPVQLAVLRLEHLAPVLVDLADLLVRVELGRDRGDAAADVHQGLHRDTSVPNP